MNNSITPSDAGRSAGMLEIEAINSLLHQSYELTKTEKFDEALPLAEDGLARALQLPVSNDAVVSSCLYQLAIVHHGRQDLSRAEELYEQSLELAERSGYDDMIASSSHGLADLYFKQKEYGKAKALYEKVLPVWQKFGGPDHQGAIAALHRLANIALNESNLGEAEVLIRRVLAFEEKTLGLNHSDIARSLSILAEILIKTKRYSTAEKELTRLKSILEASEDPETRSLTTSVLLHFSKLYVDEGEFDYAVALSRQALARAESVSMPDYPDIASIALGLAKVYEDKGDYADAESFYQRALALAEKTLGDSHKDLSSLLTDLARLYDKQGLYHKSEVFYQRAIKILENSPGSEQNLAHALGQLGWLYLNQSEYERARPFFTRAVEAAEKALGADSLIYAIHINALASLHHRVKEYSEAESLYLSSLGIVENAHGPEQIDSVVPITGLADIYSATGQYQRAESLYRRALAIREAKLGSEHRDVAMSLDSLAWLYVSQGEYGKAEPLFRRALEIRERRFGPDNLQIIPSLNNVANVYRSLGDYDKAKQLYERVLLINERALGTEHRNVSYSLNSLGSLLLDTDDYQAAEVLLRRSLSIAEKVSGQDHPDTTYVLTLLALVRRAMGDFDEAESLNERALRIDENAYGSEDISVATDLHNLALLYTAQGDFAKAVPLFKRCLAIEEKAKGPEHPHLAETLLSVAYFYGAKGDIPRAISTLARGTEISERTIDYILTSATGTEDQKRTYMAMDAISFETRGAVSLHMQFAPTNEDAARLALTTILRRKGRVLDAVSDSVQILRRHSGHDDLNLLRQLAEARAAVATLTLNGPAGATLHDYQASLSKAQTVADRIESLITSRSAAFRAAITPVTLEQVQKTIPPDSVLVEIVAYQPFNPTYRTNNDMWGESRYAAYVLNHDGDLRWVDIGESQAIDADSSRLRASLRDPDRTDVKDIAQNLYEMLMRPLIGVIGGVRRVFLSADGELNLIPFGALVDEDGNYLVEVFSFTYLTSGRDLLRMQVKVPSRHGPLVIGAPEYDAVLNNQPSRESDTLNREFDFSRARFPPLPGTEEETLALSRVLKGATVLTGVEATKAALKQASGPIILHIATHGFFLPDQAQQPGLRRLTHRSVAGAGPVQPAHRISNPLIRSGLALAGANNRHASTDNGILTALEAAALDLWGTKLVVLSACETGLGDARVGDGVYGLRRALVIAGAESQVMSLWQVSDAATRDLMVDYYKRMVAGESRGEALRRVQLNMLKRENRSHPFYWAAFIQSGDRSRLDPHAVAHPI
jgi:CHAT domain-containing protein/Tfp pilus assembly protein PilF